MNKCVTIIPARQYIGNNISTVIKQRIRVAAYCRVSTDSDEQATSYEAQVEHYRNTIMKNEEWEFAGIFADDGISGTNTKKREEFNRMIEECMLGNIDMIVTKSISRFARNTLDCLKYIRQLKEKNIPVLFEKEQINTLDSKGEVLLTIMASLAQQESESLSKNIKMGLQFRYQKGQVQVNHNRFMGYTKDKDGQLIIVPSEAKVIKLIYNEYLQGKSLKQIGEILERDGILTGAGKTKWDSGGVKKILKNEKYIGDALLQKTYTVDVLTKKRVKNEGIVPQYYVENNHEAIIPREIYLQVQDEMLRRANLYTGRNKSKRLFSCKYALSNIVYCSKCEDIFRRVVWNSHGRRSTVWRCVSRHEHGPDYCDARTVKEEELHSVVVKAINQVVESKDKMFSALEDNIINVLNSEDENSLESINEMLELKQKELLKRANSKQDYNSIVDEIEALHQSKQQALMKAVEQKGYKQRIDEMKQFIDNQRKTVEEYDDELVRRMIKKITVYEDKFVVLFKSGVSVEVES